MVPHGQAVVGDRLLPLGLYFGLTLGLIITVIAGDIAGLLFAVLGLAASIHVLVTAAPLLQGRRVDPRRVLAKQVPVVTLFVIMFVLQLIYATQFGHWGRHAPGVATLMVFHVVRLHGFTSHPPRSSLSALGVGVIAFVGLLELGVALRLLGVLA